MWTLKEGMDTLPRALHENLRQNGVDVRLGSVCDRIEVTDKGLQVRELVLES